MYIEMKIILVGPGLSPIPPVGWGAIESLIWDYFENLQKMGVDVTIMNSSDLGEVIRRCNAQNPDVVHIMYDDYIIIAPYLSCKKILYSSHYAYITHNEFETKFKYYFNNIFMKVIENQAHITLHSISPIMNNVYRKHGYSGLIRTISNGAREDKFRYTTEPSKSNRSVYVAKVEFRKGQYKYQSIPNIDFVGNYFDSPFFVNDPNYLGEWTKPALYDNLTDYGNLVLLSQGEADPLVVKEGLIAGLGVVISECCTANLDLSKSFITVIPKDKMDDLVYISEKIEENRIVSNGQREAIRQYALENFAWSSIVKKYVSAIIETP